MSQNSTVTLSCRSVTPTEWFSIHFQHQSKSIEGNSLTLFNLQGEHSGEYICRGSYYNREHHHVLNQELLCMVPLLEYIISDH